MQLERRTWAMVPTLVAMLFLVLNAIPAMAVQVGDKAPDFSLPATTAERISLADFVGKKPVVVFFYVYAFTNT
jgi:AhpC/TSA family